jgi:hypothetical protein
MKCGAGEGRTDLVKKGSLSGLVKTAIGTAFLKMLLKEIHKGRQKNHYEGFHNLHF